MPTGLQCPDGQTEVDGRGSLQTFAGDGGNYWISDPPRQISEGELSFRLCLPDVSEAVDSLQRPFGPLALIEQQSFRVQDTLQVLVVLQLATVALLAVNLFLSFRKKG